MQEKTTIEKHQNLGVLTARQKDLIYSIKAGITPAEATEKISRVSEWWGRNIEGISRKQGDVFTYHAGNTWVTFKIAEVIPDKKIVWHVTDCNLHWIHDKKEWKDTSIVWDIAGNGEVTQIHFTHLGLVPGMECYNDCEKGWSDYIQQSLFQFLTKDKGLPDKF